MSTKLSTVDNLVDNGHFCGHLGQFNGQMDIPVDNRGQSWTLVDNRGQSWTLVDMHVHMDIFVDIFVDNFMDKRGQVWTAAWIAPC
jgi:hypothetical protein